MKANGRIVLIIIYINKDLIILIDYCNGPGNFVNKNGDIYEGIFENKSKIKYY